MTAAVVQWMPKPVRAARRCDHDVAGARRDVGGPDLEVGLSGIENEYLGIGMAVKLGAGARAGVDQEQRNRDVAVVGADELLARRRAR
jgi:hypothetical protein